MKRNPLIFLLLLFIVPALTACNTETGGAPATEAADQSDTAPVQTDTETDVEAEYIADCPEATPGIHQLINAAQGICFLYPDKYGVSQTEEAFTLYVQSPLNTEAPLASVSFEPANGRSLDEVTTQRLADYAFPDSQPQSITLGGEPAVMLDNLPGQDANRRVFTIHNGTVIDLMIARIGADYGEVGVQAEALYEMINGSFQFIPKVADALQQAGPECPEPVENSTLYTNEIVGYCLLLPAGYSILEVKPEAMDNEMAFYVNSIQDASHARLSIKVTNTNGRSLGEITTAYETEIETTVPGYDLLWSFGYMLDGEPANQFDQVPGQDLSRQVVAVHDGRYYTLTFIPNDPAAGDAYSEMQTLYDTVMSSFSFLWQK